MIQAPPLFNLFVFYSEIEVVSLDSPVYCVTSRVRAIVQDVLVKLL